MKNLLIILGILALGTIAWFLWVSPSSTDVSPVENAGVINEENPEEKITLEGDFICLPHKNTDGAHTDECAFGLQTDEGENHALHVEKIFAENPEEFDLLAKMATGERMRVVGILSAPEPDQKYDIVGVVEVEEVAPVEN